LFAAKRRRPSHNDQWPFTHFTNIGPVPFSVPSARLTELVLLGNVALRAGSALEWDGPAMQATNVPEAGRFIKETYRKGWELE
jgi:hypothetical protein